MIRKAKTSSVRKGRVAVKRKLYYGYLFTSEFSGKAIDHDDAKAFRHQFYKKDLYYLEALKVYLKELKK